MSREGPCHSVNEQMMENPKQLAMGTSDITWNEKQHILQQKEQCEKTFLKELKAKIATVQHLFVLTGITWQGTGLGGKKGNILRKKPKRQH